MESQLSFIEEITKKDVVDSRCGAWEILAAGLKRERMGAVDRQEHLEKQIERMKNNGRTVAELG